MAAQQVEELIGAIDIYTRICPTMLATKPLTTINDNIYDIIKYLIISNGIIQLIMDENNDDNIQFQFDITIACNSVHSTQRVCSLLFDELEDDEDDNEAVDGPYEDVLGNVYRKLNENKLKNINVTLSARRKPENMDKFEEIDELDKDKLIHLCSEIFNITSTTQEMDELNYNQQFIFMKNERFQNNNFSELCNVFSKFRLLSLQKTLDAIYKDLDISEILLFNIIDFELDINSIKQWLSKMLDINQKKNHFEQDKYDIMNAYKKFACLYKDNEERKQSYNTCNYPIKHRINMFIDRRSNNYFDDVRFYECPSGSNMLPLTKNNEMTQKCLIPKIGYVDGENEAIHTLNMQTQEGIRNSPGGNVLH